MILYQIYLVHSIQRPKAITITVAFEKYLDDSGHKTLKLWVDQGIVFCNRSMKKWLHDNAIEILWAHNEAKSVVAERFIGTLKNKFYKHMTPVSKNVYTYKLDKLVDNY